MNKQVEAIRAEIERRINEIIEMGEAGVVRHQELETLVGLETYLDNLQEQEPEVDLEKEIDEFWSRLSEEGTTFDMIEETARHFYELGQASVPMPEDTVLFQKGVAEGKRLMMEDAVECMVTTNLANRPIIYLDQLQGFQYGDKVKIIIVKEDER